LGEDLGLTVDHSCDRDDSDCVKKAVKDYAGKSNSKNVLICWEHDELTDIADALGIKNPPSMSKHIHHDSCGLIAVPFLVRLP
jgi:hypothetical protein